jgi:hypothetical protein
MKQMTLLVERGRFVPCCTLRLQTEKNEATHYTDYSVNKSEKKRQVAQELIPKLKPIDGRIVDTRDHSLAIVSNSMEG